MSNLVLLALLGLIWKLFDRLYRSDRPFNLFPWEIIPIALCAWYYAALHIDELSAAVRSISVYVAFIAIAADCLLLAPEGKIKNVQRKKRIVLFLFILLGSLPGFFLGVVVKWIITD